jgi:hypothetical protein
MVASDIAWVHFTGATLVRAEDDGGQRLTGWPGNGAWI